MWYRREMRPRISCFPAAPICSFSRSRQSRYTASTPFLQHGGAIQRGAHALVADGLKVSSLSPQGAVFIELQDRSHLKVAAQDGAAEVRNPAGSLVARLEPGKALSFAIQVSQQNSTSTPAQQTAPPRRQGKPHLRRCATNPAWHSPQGPSGSLWALSADRLSDQHYLRTPGARAR